MLSTRIHFAAVTAAPMLAGEPVRALNNNNANTNTRIHGWAGV